MHIGIQSFGKLGGRRPLSDVSLLDDEFVGGVDGCGVG